MPAPTASEEEEDDHARHVALRPRLESSACVAAADAHTMAALRSAQKAIFCAIGAAKNLAWEADMLKEAMKHEQEKLEAANRELEKFARRSLGSA